MDFDAIPDDVWIEIFEQVDEPETLAMIVRTCHHLRLLARRPLLREIRWKKPRSTQHNLDVWNRNSFYQTAHAVPRKLTLGVEFEFATRPAVMITPETRLHDAMWEYLPRFTSLNELILDGTSISLFSYTILAQMPSLRSLTLTNCTYFRLATSFTLQAQPQGPQRYIANHPSFPFSSLSHTHLSIDEIHGTFDSHRFHPLNLIAASGLTSLSLSWTESTAQAYASNRRTLPNLTELEVSMPVLTRDLIDSFVQFVDACTLTPRISLSIDRHNLSDQQIGTVSFPLRNVCYYQGPLPISCFGMTSHMVRNQGANAMLRVVKVNQPVDLRSLLDGMERLTSGIEKLEVMVRTWDIEILFAIRELFPRIQELVIRYGKGDFSPDFFVTLGADILFDLPHLATFKLYRDPSCAITTRQANSVSSINVFQVALAQLPPNSTIDYGSDDEPDHPDEMDVVDMEHKDLEDYLIGWKRYCKKLRHVQVRRDMWWKRYFEGDVWREVVAEERKRR